MASGWGSEGWATLAVHLLTRVATKESELIGLLVAEIKKVFLKSNSTTVGELFEK